MLYAVRTSLKTAPHVKLHLLRRFDDRVAAHLDGLRVAADAGRAICLKYLEDPGAGELFAATSS